MIRLIILFAIFLAVYPMIGDGWTQFSNDINLTAVSDFSKCCRELFKSERQLNQSAFRDLGEFNSDQRENNLIVNIFIDDFGEWFDAPPY